MVRDTVVIIVIIRRVKDAIIVRVIVSLNDEQSQVKSLEDGLEKCSPHHPADTTRAPVSRRNPNINTAALFILTK